MQLIVAVIRPERLEAVRDALVALGVGGMTATNARGFGRQKGQTEHYRGEAYRIRFIPKVKLEVVVQASSVSDVLGAIASAAKTGQVGDGKVFVLNVPNALRIRTGECGVGAL